MRIDFRNVGKSKIYINTDNKEYIEVCDILGNVYKVKRENIIDVNFIPDNVAITIMGLPTSRFKSTLKINFKDNKGKGEEKLVIYSDASKLLVENAYKEIMNWIN
ncbi:hypothetical protein [Clostridium chauvoei]|uniref:Uncharacterized protein n=2 Tax=Clostridium chauvoei TaxID=46867 RepID=S6EM27_9CLOT|nr:hypothetical protein [Clostridium chauvoei]ATD55555.1 hypothetical protein BTM20_10040 [Clostridium chauvoei]ATD56768.1 hypothetical protein BTM21_02985 [Clostridium chauvoei]MBX7281244.1 hypothetical protein [Clostridium chauvoei]MBX7283726.1 hypothetical protein [Clostridium chauvoei]MBX7286333.1 hypothetical protein [Clostridium chauvoei]